MWSYGVMVSTLDSESSDPSSNLGKTWGIVLSFYSFSSYSLFLTFPAHSTGSAGPYCLLSFLQDAVIAQLGER